MASLQALFPYPSSPCDAPRVGRGLAFWPARILSWGRRTRSAPLILRHVAPRVPGEDDSGAGRPSLGEIGEVIATAALQRVGGLMNAYVASAVDVALEAEAMSDGTAARRVRTPIHDLVTEVADALQPCARAAGATLAYDRDSRWSCAATTDPGRLRKALTHLVLRAMGGGAEPGGLVRILVAAEPTAVRITVLPVRGGPEPGLFDLAALVRLVQGVGAALVVEPARAGCTPISIVLPTPVPQARTLAYGAPTTAAAACAEARR